MATKISGLIDYPNPVASALYAAVDPNDLSRTKSRRHDAMFGNQPYSYIVYRIADTYYAKSGITGVIEESDTNFDTVLQNCINTLSPTGGTAGLATDQGGTIFLRAGVYQGVGEINVRNNITIMGEGMGTKYISGFLTGPSAPEQNSGGFRQNTQDNVRFTNFQIDATNVPFNIPGVAGTHSVLQFINCQNFYVDHMYIDCDCFAVFYTSGINATNPVERICKNGFINNNIFIAGTRQDTFGGGRNTTNADGPQTDVTDIHVENNISYKLATGGYNDYNAMDTVGTKRQTIKNNTFYGNVALGYETGPHDTGIFEGNIICPPVANKAGIQTNSFANIIPNFLIDDNSTGGLSGRYQIRGNTIIYGSSYINIGRWTPVQQIKKSIFSQNICINNPSYTGGQIWSAEQKGLSLNNCHDWIVSDNIFDGNASTKYGLELIDCSECDIADNHIIGYSGTGGHGIKLSGTNTGHSFSGGRIKSCATPIDVTLIDGMANVVGVNPIKYYSAGNSSTAITITRVNGDSQLITMTGNATITLTNGQIRGDRINLTIVQSSGGHTVAFSSNVKKVGGAFTASAGAAAKDKITLEWDGTNWNEIGRALNLS